MTSDSRAVLWSVDPTDSSSAQPGQDSWSVEAALAGAADVLDTLATANVDIAQRVLHVVHVGLNHVDSEPTAVRAASGAATAAAFHLEDQFEVVFDNGWKCRSMAK